MYWISRERSCELIISILSHITNATDNTNIEYIVAIDNDDIQTIQGLNESSPILQSLYGVKLKILKTDRFGYHSIYKYHNLVAENFTGECMCTVNDDMFCLTQGWDDEIRKCILPHQNEPLLVYKKGKNEKHKQWPTAHGINRKWYNIASNNQENYAFMHPGMDVWLQRFAKEFKLKIVNPEYEIIHLQKSDLRSSSKRNETQQLEYEKYSQHHMELVKENFKNWKNEM